MVARSTPSSNKRQPPRSSGLRAYSIISGLFHLLIAVCARQTCALIRDHRKTTALLTAAPPQSQRSKPHSGLSAHTPENIQIRVNFITLGTGDIDDSLRCNHSPAHH